MSKKKRNRIKVKVSELLQKIENKKGLDITIITGDKGFELLKKVGYTHPNEHNN